MEGHSFGVYDKNGFNNAYPISDNIDYLFMGSSQIEALQVMPDKNCVYILNQKLNENSSNNSFAYSIGTSGEIIIECMRRMPFAINTYHPQKAIILETPSEDFSEESIEELFEDVDVGGLLFSYNGGVMSFIRKLPFVRLAYIQLEKFFSGRNAEEMKEEVVVEESLEFDSKEYEKRITTMIQKAVDNSNGIPIIIIYRPSVVINDDGSISLPGNQDMIAQFERICEENGVHFLNMSDRFQREFDETYALPYGFANTPAGSGHLNESGHYMIADELNKLITEAF